MPRGDELPRSISYIPYGEIFVEESDNEGVMPYRFNAKELDEETGLYYYGARYLDPTSVGWLSVDPLFEKYVGMSPYGYCAGNPVKLVDTDGREVVFSFDTEGKHDSRVEMNKGFVKFYSDFPDVSPDVILMSMHGNKEKMVDANGKEIKTPEDVKNWLNEHSAIYQQNNSDQANRKPSALVLLSCSTGDGEGCLAQRISQSEEIPLVIAPNKTLWSTFDVDGHPQQIYKENKRKPNEPGSWVVYYKGVAVSYYSGGNFLRIFGNAYQISEILNGKTVNQLIEQFKKLYEIKQKPYEPFHIDDLTD